MSTSRIPNSSTMTPEKYRKLSPAMKKAYNKKFKSQSKSFDDQIISERTQLNNKTADALIDLVMQNNYVAARVTMRWLEAHGKVMIDQKTN